MESNTAGQAGKTPARVTEGATIATAAGVVIAQTRRVDLTTPAEPSSADSIAAGDYCERDGQIVQVAALDRTGRGAHIDDRNGIRYLVNLCTLTKRDDLTEGDYLAARFPERDQHGKILAYYVRSASNQRGPYASRAAAEATIEARFPEYRVTLGAVLGANGRSVYDPNHRAN